MNPSRGNTGFMPISNRLVAAKEIAQKAGEISLEYFRKIKFSDAENKDLQDYVTIADKEVEKFIQAEILKRFPQDSIKGEEQGGTFESDGWLVDPIDGTLNFIKGIPQFCTSIAYVEGGKPVLGVIYHPSPRECFWASQGEGAFCNGEKISVTDVGEPSKALITCGYSHKIPKEDFLKIVGAALDEKFINRIMGSAALDLCNVASGRIDGFWELHLNSWDYAAGLILVREAGGRHNDATSQTWVESGSAILASNPHLYPLLEKITGF